MSPYYRFLIILLMSFLMVVPTFAFAQEANSSLFTSPPDTPKQQITLPNLTTLFGDEDNPIEVVVNVIVRFLLLVGGIVAFFYVLYGGIKFVLAGANTQAVDQARKMIIGGLVGILIMGLSYAFLIFLTQTIIPQLVG